MNATTFQQSWTGRTESGSGEMNPNTIQDNTPKKQGSLDQHHPRMQTDIKEEKKCCGDRISMSNTPAGEGIAENFIATYWG